MNTELVILGLVVGIGTYLFRFVPTKLNLVPEKSDGVLARFFASTGPAAIATLFIAGLMPALTAMDASILPAAVGSAATVAAFLVRRNVALATLAGAVSYGLVYQLLLGWM